MDANRTDTTPEEIHLHHDGANSRYELRLGQTLASHAEYSLQGSTITFTHTLTNPRLRGRGLAAQVVQFALDDARREQRRVVPQCWFVAEFIDEHPEYADLLGPSATD